jgi:hypothetical protein
MSEQNLEGTSVVPQEWVNGDDAFLLKVQGESMIGAHICPGDQALVRRQSTAENGDIVVALLNDEATIKRILFRPDGIVLQPENPAMTPIQVKKARRASRSSEGRRHLAEVVNRHGDVQAEFVRAAGETMRTVRGRTRRVMNRTWKTRRIEGVREVGLRRHNDLAFWRTQPYHIRLAALEIRQEYHR